MSFPNSPSVQLSLLTITNIKDAIGNTKSVIKTKKEVVGINRSITQSEYQTAIQMQVRFDYKIVIQGFLYDGSKFAKINDQIYKIERTYINGQFIELYLSSIDNEVEDG